MMPLSTLLLRCGFEDRAWLLFSVVTDKERASYFACLIPLLRTRLLLVVSALLALTYTDITPLSVIVTAPFLVLEPGNSEIFGVRGDTAIGNACDVA
jgi:hypothetical protein